MRTGPCAEIHPALPGSVRANDFAHRQFRAIQPRRNFAQLHELRATLLERADQRREALELPHALGLRVNRVHVECVGLAQSEIELTHGAVIRQIRTTHHLVECRQRGRNFRRREHAPLDDASVRRDASRVAAIVECHRVERDKRRIVRAPSRRRETPRGFAEDGAIHLERVAKFLAHAVFADVIEMVLPSHVIVAVHAKLEAARLQVADDFGERERDRPRRQQRARQNRARAVHRDGLGAEHLRQESAISKHAQDCAPRIVRTHRDVEARGDALALEHRREPRYAQLEPLVSIDVDL